MKKLRITVDGRVFDVTVEQADTAAPAAARPAAVAAAATPVPVSAPVAASAPATVAPAPAGAVVSPLAGKIVSIDVQVGATVAVGAQLLTIEAMKMNTFVFADRPGKVTGVMVKPGDAVAEGGALLTLG